MISISPLNNPEGVTQQEYSSSIEVLIPVVDSTSEFNPVMDQVIFSVETVTGDLLASNKVSNFSIRNYENTINEDEISSIVVFPAKDIEDTGYDVGVYNVYYNFYRNALKSNEYKYFIQEISPSRTEIRLSVNNVSNLEIGELVGQFQSLLEEGEGFKDFYININGFYYISNNVLLDEGSTPYTVLIKLYQPLPSSITVNTQLQVVFETAETVGFELNLPPTPIIIEEDTAQIKGPNFSFQLSDNINNSTPEESYESLVGITQLTSSFNELENILNQKGIVVNIDYTNFDNFIQFSSAEQRLLNFNYKVGQIESYNNSIISLGGITGATGNSTTVSSSRITYENQITDLIKNFDGYENFLYYTSGAFAWPKGNIVQPYTLQSTGSSEVLTWLGSAVEDTTYYGGRLLSGSNYDNENLDNLYNTVPTYLREDPANAGYELFLNMVGQLFDMLYSYINTITDKYDADNRLDYGISKDLVADALRGAGLKLYQNNFSSDDMYSALLGINASGSLLPPTGSQVIETYVTASSIALPLENINKETYKRLYHNLPYLLKKKGTVEGLRALINCFGIPDTILRISEFGGKDKNNTNDYDYFQDRFSYSLYANSSGQVITPWTSSLFSSPSTSTPNAIFFRFKADGVRDSQKQALLIKDDNDPSIPSFHLTLQQTGSGTLTSGSYSGSIISQSADYGTLNFSIANPAGGYSASINLPFFNNDWWSVGIIRDRYDYKLYAGQNIYDGNDGFKIGYYDSSSVFNTNPPAGGAAIYSDYWNTTGSIKLSNNIVLDASFNLDTVLFQGYYQELRFYNSNFMSTGTSPNLSVAETMFKDFTMNPTSLESLSLTGSTSAFNSLSFRAPLGNELISSGSSYIPNIDMVYYGGLPTGIPFSLPLTEQGFLSALSVHPAVTASSILLISQSFGNNSNYIISASINPSVYLIGEKEFIYYDQTAVGIKNRVSEKINTQNVSLPSSGDTLSPYRSVQQNYPSDDNYTKDINYVEVAFSPQNEVNNDINSTLGYFNIGEYIGDPRQVSESVDSYPQLDKLRDTYFEKYYTNYDWKDYIRLIKYFDNSLFKMIQDFTPANSGLASGVVIKQHLLERNKQRPPQVTYSEPYYTGSINSGFISGGAGGSFNELNALGSSPEGQSEGYFNAVAPFVTQSWSSSVDTPVGPQIIIQSSQDEFYNGELSGSNFVVTDGNLNVIPPLGTTQKSKSYVYGTPNNNAGVRSFQDSTLYNSTLATLLAIFPTDLKQSILFLDLDNVGVVSMILGWKTGDEIEGALDDVNYGDTINITFTDNGGFPSQPIGVPYTFTVGNVVKYADYFELNFINPPQPSPGSYLFNGYTPLTPMLADVDARVDIIQTPQDNLVILNSQNPLYNNVPNNRPSTIYQDIDYANGTIIPVNFTLLLNNEAVKFPIPDSNYTQVGWVNGRYNGSRNSSSNFNIKN